MLSICLQTNRTNLRYSSYVRVLVYFIWMGETLSNMSTDAIIDFKDT